MDPYLLKISFTKLVLGVAVINGITALLVRRMVEKNLREEYNRYLTYFLDHMSQEDVEILKLDLMYMRPDE